MTRQELSLQAFIGILRTSNAVETATRQDIKKYGLNVTEFSVLEVLFHKGRQTTQGIKNKILIASSSTTYVIDQLEKKGLVNRILCQEDKRVTYVEISESGKELMARVFPCHAQMIEHIFDQLTDEEIQKLKELLKKVN